MSQDLEKFGMPEEELFAPVDHSDLNQKRLQRQDILTGILYSVYFLRKKINIIILAILGVLIAFTYLYPLFVEYDKFGNLMDATTKHLSPSALIERLGMNIHWILGTGATGQSTFDAVWFGSRISISLAFICAMINLSVGVVVGSIWGFSKKVDVFMQEVYNILANIPYILLIAVMVMLFKAGF